MASESEHRPHIPSEADFVIVGAGHNGLTAGCYLARAGHRVAVVEASPTVGGMTSTNATLDSAPRHLFNEGAIQLTGIFRLSGVAEELELHKYGFREIPADPSHIQLGPDGSSLAVWKDASRTADELRKFSPRDARAWLDLANALDPAMDLVVAYMKSHPLRPFNSEMFRGIARAVRHPRRLWSLRHLATASHTEFLEETFETELPKGALAAMAAFSQMRLDMTAWAMIYLGVVQRVRTRCRSGVPARCLPRCTVAWCARRNGPHRQPGPPIHYAWGSRRGRGTRIRATHHGPTRCPDHVQSGHHTQRSAAPRHARPHVVGQGTRHPAPEDPCDLTEDQRRDGRACVDAQAREVARRWTGHPQAPDRLAHARRAGQRLERTCAWPMAGSGTGELFDHSQRCGSHPGTRGR